MNPTALSAAGGVVSRRAVLHGLATASVLGGLSTPFSASEPQAAPPRTAAAMDPALGTRDRRHYAVIGAGVFGSFTALALRRAGARVTLLDPWGPGNSRSSSGGETRVIRGVYGGERRYTELALRAFELWRENEQRWGRRLLHPTGALWMSAGGDDTYLRAALPVLREFGFPYRELSAADAARQWPQIRFDGVSWALHEEDAGYLLARQACAAAVEGLVAEGGEYRQSAVQPGAVAGDAMAELRLSDGATLRADAYVFACGPWLPTLFPETLSAVILPTRQDVLYFGTPAGDPRFDQGQMPIWCELGAKFLYGIPGNERRGFKVADDTRGEPFDPTGGERVVSPAALRTARELFARRFPALVDAPLVESRVCQYENTPDLNFLLDRHPGAANAWLVGGGSGHGFKFGPAWGERVAATVRGEQPVDRFFALGRFAPASHCG
jgi:glycine/D-amino acid oxidase-like deaminating enzyme